jgi:arginase
LVSGPGGDDGHPLVVSPQEVDEERPGTTGMPVIRAGCGEGVGAATVVAEDLPGLSWYPWGVTTILVPFHHDERVDLSVPADVTVVPELPGGDIWARLTTLYRHVAEAVSPGDTIVSGDCLVSAGVVAGVQRAGIEPVIVWFDAHGDVHTLDTSTSGYLGGLSLRLLLGAHREIFADRIGFTPIAEENAVLVDARDLDPAETNYLATAGIHRTTVRDLDGIPDGPVILHVDVDVIDDSELPGLRFPASGGPSKRDVIEAVQHIRETRDVVAFDVACTWTTGDPGLVADMTAPPRT